MLQLYVNKSEVPVSIVKFPAGESLVNIKDDQPHRVYNEQRSYPVSITCKFESNDDLINLLLLTDCVRRYYTWLNIPLDITLVMWYFPYARQDRVCNAGESLSVKVIADLINSQNFNKVFIKDAHSEVLPALLNNCINISLKQGIYKLVESIKVNDVILVSPDAGANKKVYECAKEYGFTDVVRADKTRDTTTGKITGTVVYSEHVGNRDFLILDDICDGGYTFIKLAEQLKCLTTGKIMLYVTHGIFSKGISPLMGVIDQVYTSNLMNEMSVPEVCTGFVRVV